MVDKQHFTNIKTISQLPLLNDDSSNDVIGPEDLFEVSHRDESNSSVAKYNSRAIRKGELANSFKNDIIEYFQREYNFPSVSGHVNIDKIYDSGPIYDFAASKKVYETFLYVKNSGDDKNTLSCPCRGLIEFTKNPIITDYEEWNNYGPDYNPFVMNLEKTKGLMDNASPIFIDGNSKFSSKMFNVENNLREEETSPFGTEDEKHNRYVFRITNYRSNEWTATHSGIFTCWGWVDMHMDTYPGSNAEAWLALEGYIDGKWSILQVRPFDKNNGETLSYVGFTIPVHEGLEMRITSGFRVGSNSGKYQQKNGSLTNHVANCFVGGIYYTPMVEQTSKDASDKSRSAFSSSFNFHEEKLDESKKSTIAELKAKLNKVIDKLNEIAGTNISVDDL